MTNFPSCRRCTLTLRCGGYHLYVIELDFELTKNRNFMIANPHYRRGMDCLYVGSTSHTCECRFRQHQKHAKKEKLGYDCVCDGKEKFHEFVRGGGHTRGSYYPGVYGLRLRPDLFFKYNPLTDQKNTMMMEAKLANMLRFQGFAVWQH
ncbi:MAG: hypothetical protein AAB929_00460 [Patescibacteria group bacterium]